MPANQLARRDKVIDFVFNELKQSESQADLNELDIKEKIGSALSAWYVDKDKEHKITKREVNHLHSLYKKRTADIQVTEKSVISNIEKLCEMYSFSSEPQEIHKKLEHQFKGVGFKYCKLEYNAYYERINLESRIVTYIFPEGIFWNNDNSDTLPGTYALKVPYESVNRVRNILKKETDGSNNQNLLIGLGTGIMIGGAGFSGSIVGMIKSIDMDNIVLGLLGSLGSLFIGGGGSIIGGYAIGNGIYNSLKDKNQKQVHTKLAEELKLYLSPELSSDKQYDFNIIRKALE
jgi:hypothetical protein